MDLNAIPSDFLSEDNVCGQSLLKLVARGHAIIAEITRLSAFIPSVFYLEPSNPEAQKYHPILMDFSYFVSPAEFDARIESHQTLLSLDREFKSSYFDIILRFYAVFESIFKFATDINRFVSALDEGVYIQLSLETVFQNNDGKQLLCELLYLYGIMLYTLDLSIEGLVRERLLVAYYRYGSHRSSTDSAVDQVGKLIRSIPTQTKGGRFTRDDYFFRLPISESFVSLVITRLRSDELYGQSEIFPLPEERSAAYSGQAAMLCVALFFCPSIMREKKVIMREVVDRFFPDNWVITLYTGITVNLIDLWAPYKAAFNSLTNTLEMENIKNQISTYVLPIPEIILSIKNYLRAGAMEKDVVSNNIDSLLGLVRKANVCLRWAMLHLNNSDSLCGPETNKKRWKVLSESLSQVIHPNRVLKLFISTSQLEFELFETFEQLIKKREETWQHNKEISTEILTRISRAFDGTVSLAEFEKNESYQRWFMRVSKLVESLNFPDGISVGRKIASLITSLQNIADYPELQGNLQAIQLLNTVQKCLHKMFRAANTKRDLLNQLQAIADAPYLWPTLKQYISLLQSNIKGDPSTVIRLRAAFLKISSVLNYPLIRINEASSPDLDSVSQHYSALLVGFIEDILQIIPKTIIEKLNTVSTFLNRDLRELPQRLPKTEMRDYMQLDKRYQIAEIIHSISLMAQGILVIETTLVGVVKIDFKNLLDNGIRREIVNFISAVLFNGLALPFSRKGASGVENLEEVLGSVSRKMNSFIRALEYSQDYICIEGLRIWQEELTRTVMYYVERESNVFLKNKIRDWSSSFQSTKVPITFHGIPGLVETSFVTRLAEQIMDMTDPSKTLYEMDPGTWVSLRGAKPVNILIFDLLHECLDVVGLRGLDKYFGFEICDLLQNIVAQLNQLRSADPLLSSLLQSLPGMLKMGNESEFSKYRSNCIDKFSRIFSYLLKDLCRVGQLQILRKQIAMKLQTLLRNYSDRLESSLRAFDKAILLSFQQHCADSSNPYVGEEVLAELAGFLDLGGFSDPFSMIYSTPPSLADFPALCVTLMLSMSKKLIFSASSYKGTRGMDGGVFVVGLGTLLKQFHPNVGREAVGLMCLCVGQGLKGGEAGEELQAVLERLVGEGFFGAEMVEEFLPLYSVVNRGF